MKSEIGNTEEKRTVKMNSKLHGVNIKIGENPESTKVLVNGSEILVSRIKVTIIVDRNDLMVRTNIEMDTVGGGLEVVNAPATVSITQQVAEIDNPDHLEENQRVGS